MTTIEFEDVNTEPSLLEEYLVSAAEARDRGIGEQSCRERKQRGHCKLGDCSQWQRSRADREIQIETIQLIRMFGIGQCTVEYLDDLHWTELAGVVFDLGAAVACIGFVAIDSQHAHQFALDGLAQDGLAVENRILELDRADALADHLPARRPLPVTVITDHPAPVAGRQSSWHLYGRVATRRGIQKRCNLLEDLAWAVLRRIEPQLDRRRDLLGHRGSDHHAVDLWCEKDASDEAPAQQAVRVGEQQRALNADHTVVGAANSDVDTRAKITAGGLAMHDPISHCRRRHYCGHWRGLDAAPFDEVDCDTDSRQSLAQPIINFR